ncbi:hypothetical protein [Streptomyces sp. NPDC001966]
MGDTPDAVRFAEALRELRNKAGSPSYAKIEELGRKQPRPVKLGKGKLSQWFSGESVPAEGQPFTVLVEVLEAAAFRRSGTKKRGIHQWTAMREAAERDRRSALAEASCPLDASDASGNRPAPAETPVLADVGKAGRLLSLLPPDGRWHGWLRKAETLFRVPLFVSDPVCDALPTLEDDPFDYVDPELQGAHEILLEGLKAFCDELNGMTDISDEGPAVLDMSYPGTPAGRNELNRQACEARDRFLSAYKVMANLLNVRGIAAPSKPEVPRSSGMTEDLVDIDVRLEVGYTLPDDTVLLLALAAAGRVRSEAFTGPYFFAVRVANRSAVPIEIAGVGIEIDSGGIKPPYRFSPRGRGGRPQLPFRLGRHDGGHALANAAELAHSFRLIMERGGSPLQVRPFALTGSGNVYSGSWTPCAELVPFFADVFGDSQPDPMP